MERLKGSKPEPDRKKGGPEISETMFEYEIYNRNSSNQDLSDIKVTYTVSKTYRSRESDGSSSDGIEET